MDARDTIARHEEGVKAWREREVGQGGDIIVCEIDGILVLVIHHQIISYMIPTNCTP